LKELLAILTGGPFLGLPLSSFNFFEERGEASTLARLLEASARARFAGGLVTVPGIVTENSARREGQTCVMRGGDGCCCPALQMPKVNWRHAEVAKTRRVRACIPAGV
jgi:hypothetical protein